MTPLKVFAATAAAVIVAIALIVTGVVVLASVGWGFVTAGGLLGVSAVGGCVALLRDGVT